jgi:16S rRNA (guanine966-N2)-methyltransferase
MVNGRGTPRSPGSIRIIGGRWRGRTIAVGADAQLRPTPNRVRETLFNWLAPYVEGARCLDLFAGTGALGIEALSRGAAEVSFVESSPRAVRQLKAELERLGGEATVVHSTAEKYLRGYGGEPFDVVFLDPPYAFGIDSLLVSVESCLAPGALVYLERARVDGLPELPWGSWLKRADAASVSYGLARHG